MVYSALRQVFPRSAIDSRRSLRCQESLPDGTSPVGRTFLSDTDQHPHSSTDKNVYPTNRGSTQRCGRSSREAPLTLSQPQPPRASWGDLPRNCSSARTAANLDSRLLENDTRSPLPLGEGSGVRAFCRRSLAPNPQSSHVPPPESHSPLIKRGGSSPPHQSLDQPHCSDRRNSTPVAHQAGSRRGVSLDDTGQPLCWPRSLAVPMPTLATPTDLRSEEPGVRVQLLPNERLESILHPISQTRPNPNPLIPNTRTHYTPAIFTTTSLQKSHHGP